MGSVNAIYGSQNITAKVVSDKALVGQSLTIDKIESVNEKLIITFKEIKEEMILNITNARKLADKFGDDWEQWSGKKLSLKIVKTTFGGNEVDGVRVVPL